MGSQDGMGNRTQDPKSSSLVGKVSIYNLTLDEVQQYLGDLGKPLSSMNLDELLKTVCTTEVDFGTLNRTVSRDLRKKTVDEVWQGIQQGHKRKRTERDVPLGEVTLEDFFIKAGVIDEPIQKKKTANLVKDSSGLSQQSLQWIQYQIPHRSNVIPGFVQQQNSFRSNPILDTAYSDAVSMDTMSDTQTRAKKRIHPGEVVEKIVERRHTRMIKNRESAARSRARKQAYTNELEIKVTRLEEENEKLKHQSEMDKLLPVVVPPLEPKYQLRRTSSTSF